MELKTKCSIKKGKDVKDSNGINMVELYIDMLLNDNGKFAVFSIGQRDFVAEALMSYLILKYEALNCMQCKNQ